jgi:hypothetical protein
MTEIEVDSETVERVLSLRDDPSGESQRQTLGLRLLRTLADLGHLTLRDVAILRSVQPLEGDPTSDPRFGWPSPRVPDLVQVVWPAPKLSLEPLEHGYLQLTPWAVHSLFLGAWGSPVPGTALRLPRCIALLVCDGLTENAAGRDLLRVSSQMEVLSFPTKLHSQLLVCGLADGVGQQEVELQVLSSQGAEIAFAIKSVLFGERTVPCFYVTSLDHFELPGPDQYWLILRLLGEEISRYPIDVRAGPFDPAGWDFGQSWTWESDVFFGERQ